ncbi:glutamate receptor ionotropic, delta-2-like [Centruroides sculpturatus]|uniref:glutamate receptor ionotropic, delta-2-like n=1 Tax=Centruroides sculpturatus TaxID=218467 RepID=UPI000C6CA53F|nr:glutamate receptor ionotropic, delta-2-like [Centruroides sculpturatus]
MIYQRLKFRYKIIEPMLDFPPTSYTNVSPTGILGQLANKTADIYPFYASYSSEIIDFVDYTPIIGINSISFVMKRIQIKPGWNAIFKPLSIEVWLTTAAIVIFVTLILPPIINYELNKREISRRWTMKTSFWFIFSSFVNQGFEISYIKRIFARIAIGTCGITILILTFSYSGTLISHLTAPRELPVPRTFVELVDYMKKGEVSLYTYEKFVVYRIITRAKTGIVKDIRDHIVTNNNFVNWDTFLPTLRKGRNAVIFNQRYVRAWMSLADDLFFISDDSIAIVPFGYAMRKGFPLKKKFDAIVTRSFESGIISRFRLPIRYKNENMETKIEALNLRHFLGAFILLGGGYLLAVICFILELFAGKRCTAVFDRNSC